MANNQLKCDIFYKIIAMRLGDHEQTVNYEWPKEEYFIHIRNLKQALNHGLVLKRYRNLLNLMENLG